MTTTNMKEQVTTMLKGIDRYNPDNLSSLERYVDYQVKENQYDLEANLAVLKLYQFNPDMFQSNVVVNILLKALTNLPHTDFVLCKCLIDLGLYVEEAGGEQIKVLIQMHSLLETCQLKEFWAFANQNRNVWSQVVGFEDSIRKYVCHVINITYQRIEKATLLELLGVNNAGDILKQNNWQETGDGSVAIANQEENIKTKNITEKIDFENVASVIASYR